MSNHIYKIALQASLVLLTASEALAAGADYAAGKASGGGGGLPQLDPTWYPSQLFWLVLIFVVLYLLFSKSILPALSGTIESRREHIQGDLDTAKQMKDEAEKVHTAYEEVLQEARNKASELLVNSENQIKAKAAEKLESLREKAAKQTQDAEAEIEKAKKAAMKEMDGIAAEIASKAAEKIVGISTDIKQAKSVIDNINNKKAA